MIEHVTSINDICNHLISRNKVLKRQGNVCKCSFCSYILYVSLVVFLIIPNIRFHAFFLFQKAAENLLVSDNDEF